MEPIASTAAATHRGDTDLADLTEQVAGPPVYKPPLACKRAPPRVAHLRK